MESNLLKPLEVAIVDPTVFLTNDGQLKEAFLRGAKALYDLSNANAQISYQKSFGPFDQLLTDGMDAETVWEQISSRNKPVTRFLKKSIQKIKVKEAANSKKGYKNAGDDMSSNDIYDASGLNSGENDSGEEDGGAYIDEDEYEGNDDDDEEDEEDGGIEDNDSEGSFDSKGRDDYDDMEGENGEDNDDDMDHGDRKKDNKGRRAKNNDTNGDDEDDNGNDDDDEDDGGSGTDYGDDEDDDDDMSGDDDFSVDSQMDLGLYDDDDELINVSDRKKQKLEEYRKKDEARKNKNKNKNKVEDSKGEDDEDGDVNDEEDNDDDDEEGGGEDDDNDEEEEGDDDEDDAEDDDDDDDDEEEEEDDDDDGDDDSNKKVASAPPTSFAQRQTILQAQIKEYESNLVKDKSWELKGEVVAKDRPENSLLSVVTDVERASKPVPIITQEYTTTIEDMIKKRISDGRFDDVARKVQTADIIGASSSLRDGLPEVSQEKSKLGLGDIYAEQFMKDASSTKKELSAKKQAKEAEVKQLFDKTCRELDALSHFFFSPRPVVADLSVTTLPVSAIAMEDPTPGFNSSHNSMAPQEVLDDKSGKRGFIKSEEEMTREDRKRRRRQKKEVNRKKAASDSNSDSNGDGNRRGGKRDDEIKDKRVVKASGKSDSVSNPVKKFSKSHQFFENLETLKSK